MIFKLNYTDYRSIAVPTGFLRQKRGKSGNVGDKKSFISKK